MLHREANRIIVILVYAVLEWVLILLLFLSSLFSRLIIDFSRFFGLKTPCLWCTRLGHIFDSSDGSKNFRVDLLCGSHAKQVSGFGFCSNHHKLAESLEMCHDCLFSMPEFACFSRTRDFRSTRNDEMKGEQNPMCSCCGTSLLCTRTSLDDLVCTQVSKERDHGFDNVERGDSDKQTKSHQHDKLEKMDDCLKLEECLHAFQESSSNRHLKYFLDCTGHNLIPVEIESVKFDDKSENQESKSVSDFEVEKRAALADDNRRIDLGQHTVVTDALFEASADDNGQSIDVGVDNESEEDENSFVLQAKESLMNRCEALCNFSLGHWSSVDASDAQEVAEAAEAKPLDSHADDEEGEEDVHVHSENEAVISIPELDMSDELHIIESVHTYKCSHEDSFLEIPDIHKLEMIGSEEVHEWEVELQNLSLDPNAPLNWETQGDEEDDAPDTPESMDSFLQFHKKVLFLEKQDSWDDESFACSVTSELEIGDGVVTIESLKSALKAERKALKILYAEFEEERSASAVAATQTMAMINRLQEEKAAMQMEALQYQRMMEEQSEYDQDALQLMNELMVKREKEIQEMEKELEECRRKLFDFEAKEQAVKALSSRNGFSPSSSINGDDNETGIEEFGEDTEEPLKQGDKEMVQSNGIGTTEQDIEEEMCHFYERLVALEADKEFLKQWISSLKQGDKELAHEILHSLRELRNVELQPRTRQQEFF